MAETSQQSQHDRSHAVQSVYCLTEASLCHGKMCQKSTFQKSKNRGKVVVKFRKIAVMSHCCSKILKNRSYVSAIIVFKKLWHCYSEIFENHDFVGTRDQKINVYLYNLGFDTLSQRYY